MKKYETIAENPPVEIYVNKIKNRIVFKTKMGYKLEILSSATIKLLESNNKHVEQDKDGGNESKLESIEVALVHFNLVNNSYQQTSKVLFTFAPNKQFGQLITISPQPLTTLKITNGEF